MTNTLYNEDGQESIFSEEGERVDDLMEDVFQLVLETIISRQTQLSVKRPQKDC